MNAIETRDLTKHFHDVAAIDDVSLTLAEGRVHGLLGRNGAGKTTLMKLLTGQIFATSGEMRVLGESPVENPQVLARTCFIQE
ncbi:MAG: ATP-binding cassette domain-containing protein, partial [Dermabacteraceae bacterium]